MIDMLAAEAEGPLIEAHKLGLSRKWDLERLFKSGLPHDDTAKADERPKDLAPVLDPSAVRAQVAERMRKNTGAQLSLHGRTSKRMPLRKKVKTETGRIEEGTTKIITQLETSSTSGSPRGCQGAHIEAWG